MHTQAFDTLGGIPSHPLLVHIPVVLVPVAMILSVLALWPRVRTGALWAASIAAAGGLIGAVLAAGSGESLAHAVKRTDLLRDHMELGDQVQGYAAVFAVLSVAALLVHLARHDAVPFGKYLSPLSKRLVPFAKKLSAGAVAGLIALASVAGIVASWQTYNAGHSGAKSVWNGTRITDSGRGDD